jgi:hypothetical protein
MDDKEFVPFPSVLKKFEMPQKGSIPLCFLNALVSFRDFRVYWSHHAVLEVQNKYCPTAGIVLDPDLAVEIFQDLSDSFQPGSRSAGTVTLEYLLLYKNGCPENPEL